MYGFDGTTGQQDRFYDLPQYDEWTPAVDEDHAYAYVGEYSPGLYVVDRITGQLDFTIPDPNFDWNGWSMDLAPVLGGMSDVLAIHNGRLIRFDLNAHAIGWEKVGNFTGQPTVVNGIVYAISAGALGAYDEQTGTMQWMWEAPGAGSLEETIIATNHHLFVRSANNTYCIDLATHLDVWSYPAAGHLSLGESALYIAGSDGTLTAISLGLPDIFAPESVDFGFADLDQTIPKSISISNVGDERLEVKSIVSSSNEFIVQSPTTPFTLSPHESASVVVNFTPVARGAKNETLLIASNDPNESEIAIALTGKSILLHTVTATAQTGGQIDPAGEISVPDGDSLSFTVTPDPHYQLVALLVDGTSVGNSLTYTLSSIHSNHSITAVFGRYFDYFGLETGNHMEFVAKYANGQSGTGTTDISLDTSSFPFSTYVTRQSLDGEISSTWCQVASQGLFMLQQTSQGNSLAFDPGLPIVPTPLTANATWTKDSTFSMNGLAGKAKITAKASPMVLVNVPAGHFLAYPITYTLKLTARGRTASQSWKDYFAPYFGAVQTTYSSSRLKSVRLTQFAIGEGTVTTPPPVVAETIPKSAARGSSITINGFQFGDSQGAGTVKIGDVECDQILSWSDTSIECIVPDTAASGAVMVSTDTWTSNASVTFTVRIPPVATGVDPSAGNRGSSLQIVGHDFGTVKGKVKIGKLQAKITQWGIDSITCTVPAKAPLGACPATVINSQGQSVLDNAFTVVK